MRKTILTRLVCAAVLALSAIVGTSAQIPSAQGHAQVIAHRGYWTAMMPQAQNSREAMIQALSHNFYGSETDVWLSADDTLMVNHDSSLGGVVIEESRAADCRKVYLHNGETMPTLRELLALLRSSATPTLLIIEIKTHADPARGLLAARKTVEMVREMRLQSRVEYIAFDFGICKELRRCDSEAKVAYLNGDLSPQELLDAGMTGLDYHIDVLRQHPEWVAEAHRLGLTVNVWTVDSDSDISEMAALGVDFITTNQPERAESIVSNGR